MAEGNTERLWTADEVADFLGMHVQTVYAKAQTGEIPSFKIGSKRRFRRHEIQAWVNTHAENQRTPEEQEAWEKVRAEEVAKRRAG